MLRILVGLGKHAVTGRWTVADTAVTTCVVCFLVIILISVIRMIP